MASLPHLDALVFVAAATGSTVGDSDGWATGTNYLAWSEKHNFTIGDVLGASIKYVGEQHDVLQVTEETIRSCDTSSGVLRAYAAGGDRVALAEPKSYWFVCNVSGHCLGGMRFGINVTSSAEPPSTVGGGGGGLSWWWMIGLLSMGFSSLTEQ